MALPPFASNLRKQTATYWAPIMPNTGFGNVSFAAPVQIACRWQDRRELFRDSQGQEVISSAVVYPATPLENKGFLVLGLSGDADPRTVEGAYEIRAIGFSPSLKGTVQLDKVWL